MRSTRSLFFAFLASCAALVSLARAERTVQPLSTGWRFALGDHAGAEAVVWDDSGWRQLGLPHDWAAEGPFAADAAQVEMGGYRPGGIGWYRRIFDVAADRVGRQWRVEFDGVYMNSEVWLNGKKLGRRPYGYISFGYDLTSCLKPGRNVLAVRVDNSREPSARWYHGCGIYAPVRLVATDDLRISPWGVQVIVPSLTANSATVEIKTEMENATGAPAAVKLRTTVLGPDGVPVARGERAVTLAAAGEKREAQVMQIASPQRWDIATPVLYTAVSEVESGGKVIDTVRTRFGFREIKWDTATGFWLNGRNIKLQGVAEHLEGGPVGAAWPDPLIRWKLRLLKDMGCNAVRTAHNPQVPHFYELCDELGLLVMDEIFDGWNPKAPEDYGKQAFAEWWRRDLSDWIRRDRNHPSVVIWSVGNETKGPEAADMVKLCHELDPNRLVTSGHSGSEQMDVFGVNGYSERKGFFTEKRPDQPFVATEAPHTWQVRGYYRTLTWYRDRYPNPSRDPFFVPDLTAKEVFNYDWIDPEKRPNPKEIFNSSYDNAMVRVTARKHWTLVRDLPWFSGNFRWTGWDYPGEASYVHGGWPFHAFMGGVIDLAGFPKDHFHFYQSQWTTAPMVHLLPHWTHPRMAPGTPIPVWAYTNAEEVDLLLDGKSLGRRRPGREWDQLQCEWLVPWAPGTLEAVAYRGGKEVARTVQRTATAPARLQVTTERLPAGEGGRDISIVTVAANDATGTFYPYGENRVGYHLEGPARLLTLESGSPVDIEPNTPADSRRMFFGLTRAFVESDGAADKVSAIVGAICGEKQQLTSDRVSIDVQRVDLRSGVVRSEKFEIRYTLDGSEPTPASPACSGSFRVPIGTTVRALVLAQGRPVLRLAERFAVDEGLHWGAFGDAPAAAPEPLRVLFLGNSFTARNRLSELVRDMAAAGDPSRKMVTTAITYGGKTMEYHWGLHSQNWVKLPALTEVELEDSIAGLKAQSAQDPENGNVRRAIQRHEALRAALKAPRPKWDYVVLQSWQDTAGGMKSAYVDYARRLAILAHQQGSKVVFYDTAPDTINAAPLTAPPPRAPAEERARMLATLAAEFDGLAVPMPLVVWHCQTQRPELPLRYEKDFHLNQTTGYLTAATIYAMIFGRSPEGLSVNEVTDNKVSNPAHPELNPDGGPQRKVFDDDRRLFLQRTVARAVADFRQLKPLETGSPIAPVPTK